MRSLLFCTAWATSAHDLEQRAGRWIRHHGSLPWSGQMVLGVFADGIPESIRWPDGVYIRRNFQPHLGRPHHLSYPGWWRSFAYASQAARLIGADRVIHVESDFYVASWRMLDALERCREGWTCFWCPRHGFPETGIQVICADRFAALDDVWDKLSRTDFTHFDGRHAEGVLPFDRIVKEMTGDRFGELGRAPGSIPGLDWYGQLGPDQEPPRFEVAGKELVA